MFRRCGEEPWRHRDDSFTICSCLDFFSLPRATTKRWNILVAVLEAPLTAAAGAEAAAEAASSDTLWRHWRQAAAFHNCPRGPILLRNHYLKNIIIWCFMDLRLFGLEIFVWMIISLWNWNDIGKMWKDVKKWCNCPSMFRSYSFFFVIEFCLWFLLLLRKMW